MTLGLALLVSLIMIMATIAWHHHNNNPYEYRQHADWVLLMLATHVITLILCTVLAYCEATSGVRYDAIKNRVAEWQIDKETGRSRFTWKTYDQLVEQNPPILKSAKSMKVMFFGREFEVVPVDKPAVDDKIKK